MLFHLNASSFSCTWVVIFIILCSNSILFLPWLCLPVNFPSVLWSKCSCRRTHPVQLCSRHAESFPCKNCLHCWCRLLHGVNRLWVWHSSSQDLHPSEVHSPLHRRHVCQVEARKQWWLGAQRAISIDKFLYRYDLHHSEAVSRRQPVSVDFSCFTHTCTGNE